MMKISLLSIFALFLFSCTDNVKKDSIQNEIKEPEYKLIASSNTIHLEYDPLVKMPDNYMENQGSEDLFFSKQLLLSLDSSLAKYNYSITISDEKVYSKSNDTFDITIYDFIIAKKDGAVRKVFNNSDFIEKRISTYEMPVTCLFLFNDDNLSSVCKRGLPGDTNLRKIQFIDYIKNSTQQRLIRK